MRPTLPLALLLLLVAAAGLFLLQGLDRREPVPPSPAPPPPAPLPDEAGFVGSETCRECHADRHATWLRTGHAYSLRAPHEGSVEGVFDGRALESEHFIAWPERAGDDYVVRVQGKGSRPSGYHTITHVVGRTFQQAYLFTDQDGAWRVVPVTWSIERGEWAFTHEVLAQIAGGHGSFPADYDTRRHVFNHGCGQCHATDYDVGYRLDTGGYRSTYLEGAVACESCHGPGAVHSAWHRQERAYADGAAEGYAERGRLLHPREDLDAEGVLQTCGRCHYLHEWRYAIDADPRVGHLDTAMALNFDQPGFFADGRLSGLNYHGSTQRQSACFVEGGMSCLDCHAMHSGKPRAMRFPAGSDAQCTQCHDAGRYGADGHHHHGDAEVGCVDCHMPRLLSGPLHGLRDHSVRSPEPELTERFGAEAAPNACNACHVAPGEGAAWARAAKEEWWGPAPPRLVADVAQVVALREDPAQVPSAELAATVAREESRFFFRRTALEVLGARADDDARAGVAAALADPDAELVQGACAQLAARPDAGAIPGLLPLLDHPLRTVRVEAAYALARAGWFEERPEMYRILEDARAMLVRTRPIPPEVRRIARIADLAGDIGALEDAWRLLDRLAAGSYGREDAEVLWAFARRLAGSDLHEQALQRYAAVAAILGERPSGLYLDAAHSLAALGRTEDATGNWTFLVEQGDVDTVHRAIATARLAAAAGNRESALQDLRELATEVAADPARGTDLRRLRRTQSTLRHP